MEQFVRISGLAAPLMRANIDTDLLIPSREIDSPDKSGYGEKLLAPWRYLSGPDGQRIENPEFVLNRVPFRNATILISGENFGSGSSREAAVWALRQFGFRCVIAPSFGAIFRNNCVRNGVLPIALDTATVQALADEAEGGQLLLTVDLTARVIVTPHGRAVPFSIPEAQRLMLMEGLDEIGLTLKRRDDIEAFERADRTARPWVWAQARS